MDLDLTVRRTPSQWRDLLEVRVRRLSARKTPPERRQALAETWAIAAAALDQHDRDHPQEDTP